MSAERLLRSDDMKPMRQSALLAISLLGGLSPRVTRALEPRSVLTDSSVTVSATGNPVRPAIIEGAAALVHDSPFLPFGVSKTQGIATSDSPMELRGIMSDTSGNLYYVYDLGKKHGVWAGRNDAENSFVIISDNANDGSLEIRMRDGRVLDLKLREGKTLAAKIDSEAPGAQSAVSAQGPGQSGLTETQAAWREEFNRRLKENATGN
jgi:hypothetical protein